jgi:FixJ family two-component response regulator
MKKSLVYLVDDQIEILELFGEILADECTVKIFTDPDKLLVKVAEGELPSVVISDVRMPQMTGTRLAEKLARINPATKVILLSGSIDKDISVQACNLGIFSILEKPVSSNVFIETVKRAIEIHKMNEKMESFRRKATQFVQEASDLVKLYKNRANDAEAILKDAGLMPHNPEDINARLLESSELQVKVQSLRQELKNLEPSAEGNQVLPNPLYKAMSQIS